MDFDTVQRRVADVAADFAAQRSERQLRRNLDKADFQRLAEAGYTLCGAPVSSGGLWVDIDTSTRPTAELVRTIARGDSSVGLVSAMHPAVLSFWLCQNDPPAEYEDAWEAQQREVFKTAADGTWWGTITSEPGSGGDVGRTKATAAKTSGGSFTISGQKHFGSGSGVTSYMITTALPQDEDEADWFYLDLRDAAWDGSKGMKLIAEWDGHGMIATQSHAFEFSGYPATRLAWPGNLRAVSGIAGPLITALFVGAIVGVTEEAYERAKASIGRRRDSLNAYERTEWTRVENEMWQIHAAYEAMHRAIEAKGSGAGLDSLQAKTAISELAESLTGRICKIVGGGSFHRASPFGAAFEDVRALGFLRPPWALAFEQIWERSWQQG